MQFLSIMKKLTMILSSAAFVSLAAAFVTSYKRQRQLAQGNNVKFHPSEHEIEWDKVDEASWESFPASDPPAIA